MISEWSADLTLTEESSKALFDVLHQQDLEFINGLLDGKHGFTLQSSDGRAVELVPAPKWIPCSERMPEPGSWAIWCSYRGMRQIARWKEDAIDHFFPDQGFFQLEDAVAWMPLPEPYNGKE